MCRNSMDDQVNEHFTYASVSGGNGVVGSSFEEHWGHICFASSFAVAIPLTMLLPPPIDWVVFHTPCSNLTVLDEMNYQILKAMFDRLLNTNRFWLGVVCCADVYPDCKAFMDQVKDYFTYISQNAVRMLVGGTDPNVNGMITFNQLPPELLFEFVHCFRAEHDVLNAVFSSSQTLRNYLLPRVVKWQAVRISKYIGLKTMHERLVSNECWGFVLGAAAFDPDCKAFMDRLKDYLEDSAILIQKAVCVPVVEFGDLSNGCATAGPHFKPTTKKFARRKVPLK
uniref:F-box domain-containing protein n=1 Tax=Globodera rostochiensis TaxID=31243 RepID=A0A914HUZ9_GLORO